MREADRDEELAVALVVELVALPLPVGRRVAAQVDRDVPDPPPQAADQLRLAGLGLEVEPAQDAAPEREWLSWTNSTSTPSSRQRVVAEGLDQEAALVAVDLGLDQDEAVELRLEAPTPSAASALPYWRS